MNRQIISMQGLCSSEFFSFHEPRFTKSPGKKRSEVSREKAKLYLDLFQFALGSIEKE